MPIRGCGCQHTFSMLYSRQILSVVSIYGGEVYECYKNYSGRVRTNAGKGWISI